MTSSASLARTEVVVGPFQADHRWRVRDRGQLVPQGRQRAQTGLILTVIGQQDIDRSALTLRGTLEEEAKAALRAQAGDAYEGEAFSFEVLDQTSDVPAGTEASSFSLTMSVRASGVFYDRSALQTIAVRKLYEQLDAGSEFAALDGSETQVTVDKADPETESANLRVYLDGLAVPSATSESSAMPRRPPRACANTNFAGGYCS